MQSKLKKEICFLVMIGGICTMAIGCSEQMSRQNSNIQTEQAVSETNVNTQQSDDVSGITESKNVPVVYMTNDISPETIMKIYNKLKFTPIGKVAVKLSTGETGNTHYLDPNLIKNFVQSVGGTIVECNTAYTYPYCNTCFMDIFLLPDLFVNFLYPYSIN